MHVAGRRGPDLADVRMRVLGPDARRIELRRADQIRRLRRAGADGRHRPDPAAVRPIGLSIVVEPDFTPRTRRLTG